MSLAFLKHKFGYLLMFMALIHCAHSSSQSVWSTSPTAVKVVGWSLIATAVTPFIIYGNTLSAGINLSNFSGSGAQNTSFYKRPYYGVAIGISDDPEISDVLIELGISNKGSKQDLSGYSDLPVRDPIDNMYHDKDKYLLYAKKLGEIDLNYWRLAVIGRRFIENQSFFQPYISFGLSCEMDNIMKDDTQGGLVVRRHDYNGGTYNGILSFSAYDHVFLNWDLIGGLGFDISINDRRAFGFEARYNYGIRTLYKNGSSDRDQFKLRDNTISILFHIYLPWGDDLRGY